MTASKQLKAELKAAFPNTKFSVTSSKTGSLTVRWVDGPKVKEVKTYSSKYESIRYCDYTGEILGGGNTFVSLCPEISDERMAKIDAFIESKGAAKNTSDYWYYRDEIAYGRIDIDAVEADEIEVLDVLTVDIEFVEDTYVDIAPVQLDIEPFFFPVKWASMNKNNTLDQYREYCALPEQGKEYRNWSIDETLIKEVWRMTPAEYDYFVNDLLDSQSFLNAKGGSESRNESKLREVESYWDYTNEEQEIWRQGAYDVAIAVICPGRETIIVNPEGCSYARYVGLCNQSINEKIAPKKLATGFNPCRKPTFTHNGETCYVARIDQMVDGVVMSYRVKSEAGNTYTIAAWAIDARSLAA